MAVRNFPQRSFLRSALLAIGIAGALWVAWQILVVAISDYYAPSAPRVALAWDSNHPEALERILEEQWDLANAESNDTGEAAEPAPEPEPSSDAGVLADSAILALSQKTMTLSPLSSVPLRTFGLLAENRADEDQAEELMALSSARSLRDIRTQIWLADNALLKDQYDVALTHIDVLLRVWPEMGASLFPLLSDFAIKPESAPAILAKVQSDPPWRASFLSSIVGSDADLRKFQAFYAGLRSKSLNRDEERMYLSALVQQGEASLAHSIWLESMSLQNADIPPVYNGDFEQPISGMPFDWTFPKVDGARASIVSDAGNQALMIEFHNTRVSFSHVSQVLLLKPGFYSLEGRMKADLRNERGLRWTISCEGQNTTAIAETQLFNGTFPWSNFEEHFRVPADSNCEAQVLTLILPARVPSEQQISGRIWFDDLVVESLAADS